MTSRAVILALVLVALVTTLALPIREYMQQRSMLNNLRQQVSQGQARVDTLKAQQRRWQDPAYIEAQARSRLHFVFPGEIGYVVLSPGQVKDARQPDVVVQHDPVSPWYDTLWSSVRQADSGQ